MRWLVLALLLAGCARSAPEPRPLELTVVTFNVQDLFVAARRRDRMRAIGRELARLEPDLVALQEAFSEAHRAELKAELERAAEVRYHDAYFRSGVMGSGLYFLSRHPIEGRDFWKYTRNGHWTDVNQGDWYAGKGVARVRAAGVTLFNTHAIANYGGEESNTGDREQQMRELNRYVGGAPATPVLVVGDLNCRPGERAYELATRGEARLEPLFPNEGLIDHLLWLRDGGYRAETLTMGRLVSGRDDVGSEIDLSDHAGYWVTLRLTPLR